MRPVEFNAIHPADNTFNFNGDCFYGAGRCPVDHPDVQHHPPFFHIPEIMNPAVHQVGIGDYNFFAAQAPDSGGLDPDFFYGPHAVCYHDIIPYLERAVEKYNEIIKKVPQYRLRSQRQGDAANTETRYNRGYVKSDVINYEY